MSPYLNSFHKKCTNLYENSMDVHIPEWCQNSRWRGTQRCTRCTRSSRERLQASLESLHLVLLQVNIHIHVCIRMFIQICIRFTYIDTYIIRRLLKFDWRYISILKCKQLSLNILKYVYSYLCYSKSNRIWISLVGCLQRARRHCQRWGISPHHLHWWTTERTWGDVKRLGVKVLKVFWFRWWILWG